MSNPYRVYNYTDRELIIATDEAGEQRYRLLGQSVSPLDVTPRRLWAASGAAIDGQAGWALDEGFDVHVTEASPGPGLPQVNRPLDPTPNLHIFGLGIHPLEQAMPRAAAATAVTFAPLGEAPGGNAPGPAWFYREDETWVTVLGAGITGLTVAHELVTRGFRVQVIERAHGSPADIRDGTAAPRPATPDGDPLVERFRRGLTGPDVGGVARTQWGTQPLGRGAAPSPFVAARRRPAPSPAAASSETASSETAGEPEPLASLRSVHGDAVWFGPFQGGPLSAGSYHAFGITWTNGQIDDFAAGLLDWLYARGETASLAAVQVVIVVYRGDGADHVKRAYDRFDELLGVLRALHEGGEDRSRLRTALERLEILPTARIDVDEDEPQASRRPYVGLYVRVHEDLGLIAGEHGFRFFPGFYRHLRDTMRRTPIFDPLTRTFTSRTAHDNLQEVRWQIVADPERPYRTALSRKAIPTIGGMIEQYRAIRRDLDYQPVDLLRFWLRLLRYMTSSTGRREADYERMTWWDFISKRRLDDPADPERFRYEPRFEEALKHTPKALVAMGSEHADARTQGNINVQLMMDQFELQDQSDSTLAGPTSTTWFDHWRTFLEEQGVRFFLGEVTEIRVPPRAPGGAPPPRARVEITFPGGAQPAEYLDGEEMVRLGRIREHYIVSALDVVGLARVTRGLRRSKRAVGAIADLDKLIGDGPDQDRDLEDITSLGRRGPGGGLGDRFQTLTGIQLYYQRHVSFANGHIYFAESPWGLSAISQIQFWGPFGSGHRGRLAGNLSIDIGSWRAAGGVPDPNTLDRDAIATGVQEQIKNSSKLPEGEDARKRKWLPHASLYHLDDFIAFARVDPAQPDAPIRPWRNHAPFLINVADEWEQRPRGEPWTPNDLAARDRQPGAGAPAGEVWTPGEGGYVVHHGNLVVAGPHMRTFTRMATMEAANESARHAVNAILDHATWVLRRAGAEAAEAAEAAELAEAAEAEEPEEPEEPARAPRERPARRRGARPSRPGRARAALERAPAPTVRTTEGPSINVVRNTTPFGDYCDIWDPELFEFEDLRFLRSIDEHLMKPKQPLGGAAASTDGGAALVPHLFDILRIDELPDRLVSDEGAVRILELVGCILVALDDAQLVDLGSVFAAVDRARAELSRLLEREPAGPRRRPRVSPRDGERTDRRSPQDE